MHHKIKVLINIQKQVYFIKVDDETSQNNSCIFQYKVCKLNLITFFLVKGNI